MSTALRPLFTNLSRHGSKKQVINLPGIYFNKWARQNSVNRKARKEEYKKRAKKTRREYLNLIRKTLEGRGGRV